MGFVADILLIAAALGAMFYCFVLSRRLSRFTDLEKGVGGAIATLSSQVDDMTKTLRAAQGSASASANSLGELTGKAEDAARRLELLVASMHDLPPVGSGGAEPDGAVSAADTGAQSVKSAAEAEQWDADGDGPIPGFVSRRNLEAAE